MGVDPKVIKWYEFCLRNRIISAEYKGSFVRLRPTRGTPQGGVLSPVMWNVAFEGLLHLYLDCGIVNIVGYADEAALVAKGPNPKKLVQMLQAAVNREVYWGRENILEFAPSKTEAMIITRRRKHKQLIPNLTIGGHVIPYVKQVTYLGVIIDAKLTW